MKKIFCLLICIVCFCAMQAQVLYGTTSDGGGGINGKGTICKLVAGTNTLTAAYTFDDPSPDGRTPINTTLVQASDGKLYGMTDKGGTTNDGTIFSYDPASATYTKLLDFNETNGSNPFGSLMQAADGKLYGMTTAGGSKDLGVIFSFNPSTGTYTKLKEFDSTIGYYPYGSLVQATNGNLYGMTSLGGSNGRGVIFSFNLSNLSYSRLRNFDSTNGANPYGNLIQATDGKLYGMTTSGGSSNNGVIFSYNPSTLAFSKLMDFNGTNGAAPYGSFVQASDGKLYGMTNAGGTKRVGVIFSFNPSSNAFAKLKDFDNTNGANPYGNLVQAADGKLYGMTDDGGTNDYGVLFSFIPATAVYAKLKEFDYDNGANPHGSLTQASNGKLYGATRSGGGVNYGVIFSYTSSSATFNTLKVFGTYTKGCNAVGGTVKTAAGKLYGMFSNGGGVNGLGGIYSFDPVSSVYTKLVDFNNTNGANPNGSLTLASDGKLYGMTYGGGSTGGGVLFAFNPSTAVYTKLKDFDLTDGRNPQGNLIQASDGKLYGMTNFGGTSDAGIIFSFNPATATYTKLVDFNNDNGATPFGSLLQASDGKLYGMTTFGGNSDAGIIFSFNPATAAFNKLVDFNGLNGAYPYGSLTQASDGKLYGMTYSGGNSGVGVVFSFNPSTATYTKIKDLDAIAGRSPRGSLTKASDGKLYGMTSFGGSKDYGTAFSITPATSAFLKIADFNGTNGKCPVYTFFTEVPPAVNIKVSNASLQEGNTGTTNMIFNVTLSQTSTQTININYNTKNGTATASSDYVAKTGTLTFSPGVKKQTIAIAINGDTQVEPNETFKVLLSNPVNAAIGDGTGLGTILNDDTAAAKMLSTDRNSNPSILVSPNPATNFLHAQLNNFSGSVTLKLTNMEGMVLKESKLYVGNGRYTQQLNVADLAGGTYFLVVIDGKGNKQMQKVLINH